MKHLRKSFPVWWCLWLLQFPALLNPGSHPAQPLKFSKQQIETVTRAIVGSIKRELPGWYQELNLEGMALAVVNDQKDLLKMESGMTALGSGRPVSEKTLFGIQSVTKSFTTVAVLTAVQDGILNLDTPISHYLPEFRVRSRYEKHPEKRITLRHLLSHRAGFTHEAPVGSNFDPAVCSFKEHIASISDTWLKYPVGYRIAYSNIGIDLAGYVLERKTGISFNRYARNRIFLPLRMPSSTLNPDKIKRSENRALGLGAITRNQALPVPIPLKIPMIPAAGIYSNTRDMARYVRFFLNRGRGETARLLKQKLIDLMFQVAYPQKYQRSGYTLGLVRETVSRTYSLAHGGAGYGFHSYLLLYPELNVGLILLLNTRESNLTGRLKGLIDQILEQNLGKTQPQSGFRDETGLIPLNPDDVRITSILGVYDKTWTIRRNGTRLEIAPDGRQFFPLGAYLEDGELVARFGEYSELRFLPGLDTRPGSMVYLHRLHDNVIFRDYHHPLDPGDRRGPDKSSWHKYIGIYIIKKWGRKTVHTFTVTIQNGHLYLNWMQCREYLPGLFFTYNGEVLDFRGTFPVFRNIRLYKLGPAAPSVNR